MFRCRQVALGTCPPFPHVVVHSSDLLARLRATTAPHHRRTEAVIPILAPTLDLVGYADVLQRMHDVVAPLETALDRVLAASPLAFDDEATAWPARRKAPLLARDLVALAARGIVPTASPAPLDAAWPDDVPSAVGALYVVEGATLGGQVVLRQVAPRLGLAPEAGCAFYAAYGARTGAMWKAFGAAVGRWEAAHAAEGPAVVAAACRTFERLASRFAA